MLKYQLEKEDIFLNDSFENVRKYEILHGKPLMLLGQCLELRLGFSEVVDFVFLLQKETSFSKDEIYSKIKNDGLAFHNLQLAKFLKDACGIEKFDLEAAKKKILGQEGN